jgi:hypothetical protein
VTVGVQVRVLVTVGEFVPVLVGVGVRVVVIVGVKVAVGKVPVGVGVLLVQGTTKLKSSKKMVCVPAAESTPVMKSISTIMLLSCPLNTAMGMVTCRQALVMPPGK